MFDLIWLLALGFLFYWMMKNGCGMHGHGGGHGDRSDEGHKNQDDGSGLN